MGRERVSAGELSAADAVEVVQSASAYEEIDQFAKIDHQRTKRTGACAVLPAAEGLPLMRSISTPKLHLLYAQAKEAEGEAPTALHLRPLHVSLAL